MDFEPVDFIRTYTRLMPSAIVPEIPLHLAVKDTPIWKLTEERMRSFGFPPPFWAFAWPGGQGMARYILDHPEIVRGKRVVDFASGSGIAAIAAMKAGAKSALAIDIDTLALQAIKLNAYNNHVVVKISEGIDLTKPYKKADVIFAGDSCYLQTVSTKMVRWLRYCVEKGVLVLLSDPGRAYTPTEGMVKLASYDVPVAREIEDRDLRTTTVWRMEKIVADEEN
jgi:predicted nicotinamide N-methyase